MRNTDGPRLVLASVSPRRRELLGALGLEFDVAPADIDETALHGAIPSDGAARAALGKASVVAERSAGRLVLGADTMVVLDGRVFGKPSGRDQAREFLQTLSGRTHTVITGVALIDGASGQTRTQVEQTPVTFRVIRPDELETYLDTPDPYDKAGSYGVQSGGRQFVARIDGDFYNVMGLPLGRVVAMLGEFMDTRGLSVPPPPWP